MYGCVYWEYYSQFLQHYLVHSRNTPINSSRNYRNTRLFYGPNWTDTSPYTVIRHFDVFWTWTTTKYRHSSQNCRRWCPTPSMINNFIEKKHLSFHKAFIFNTFFLFFKNSLMFVRLLLLPLYFPATLPRKKLTEVLVDYLKYRPCYFQP